MTQQTAGTLSAAADYLETHDLHKGSLTDGRGNVCVLGAIRAAVTGPNFLDFQNADECERFDDAANALGGVLDLSRAGIPKWNDAPERTKEEVVRALRDTADLEVLDHGVPFNPLAETLEYAETTGKRFAEALEKLKP